MRSAYLVLIAAGCGFRSAGSEVVPDGGVSGMHMFTAAELGAGARVDMTVDGVRGSLTPNAYSYGGLTVHGLKGQRLWMHSDTDWNKLSTVTSTGAGLWCGERLGNKVAGTQPDVDYLGVPEDATMTLWFEGEVWLDGRPGAMLHPSGDDLAFVDIAPPKSTVYMRLAENAQVAVPASVMASGAGWYPIRVGFGNGDGTFDFSFTHSDAGGPEIAWTRDRMRARTSELGGVLRTVYGQEILGGGLALPGGQVAPPVPHFEQDDLLAPSDFSNSQLGPPQGAPADDAHWSARYAGQVYIATPGMYTLQTETDDGNRARLGVDGHDADAFALNHGVGGNAAITRPAAMLSAGWNDLTVDLNQASGGANIHVRIQGPDFPSLVEIPRDRLRPVEPADDRLALGADDTADNIPDNGGQNNDGTATMTVVGFTGTGGAAGAAGAAEVVDSIELVYEINSPHWDQLRVDLEAPATGAGPGARVTIRDKKPGPGGDGDRSEELSLPANAPAPLSALRGGPASGAWKLHVFDDDPGGPGNASTLLGARLVLHTRAGPDKVARTASWTSPVIDAGTAVFAVDHVTWNERAVAGVSKVAVSVRTCTQPDCSGASWPDPRPQGTAFNVTRGRYLQLRVDMASDGAVEPELGGLAIAFRHDPP